MKNYVHLYIIDLSNISLSCANTVKSLYYCCIVILLQIVPALTTHAYMHIIGFNKRYTYMAEHIWHYIKFIFKYMCTCIIWGGWCVFTVNATKNVFDRRFCLVCGSESQYWFWYFIQIIHSND